MYSFCILFIYLLYSCDIVNVLNVLVFRQFQIMTSVSLSYSAFPPLACLPKGLLPRYPACSILFKESWSTMGTLILDVPIKGHSQPGQSYLLPCML